MICVRCVVCLCFSVRLVVCSCVFVPVVIVCVHFWSVELVDINDISRDRRKRTSRRRSATYMSMNWEASKADSRALGSFFQHDNNSVKREFVTFHGACNECNLNIDALRISNATLECLAFQTCMTLCV